MEIKWFGQACFEIKGDKATLIIDPFDEKTGLAVPKLQGDVLAITNFTNGNNNLKAVSSDPFLITGSGEYEASGIFVNGIPAFHNDKKLAPAEAGDQKQNENTIYIIQIDGIKICHLGDLNNQLTNEQLDLIDGVDILMIPVGGVYTIDAKKAVKIVEDIEPRIVIPMYYQIPNLKVAKEGLKDVKDFAKEMGIKEIKKKDSLKVKKDKLPQDKTEAMILRASK